jgi:hypothetical protein
MRNNRKSERWAAKSEERFKAEMDLREKRKAKTKKAAKVKEGVMRTPSSGS